MFSDPFPGLSDHAMLWIYGFQRKMNPAEEQVVRDLLNQFTKSWKSHGNPVEGRFAVLYHQFIILATEQPVSGCSIDSSVRLMAKISEQLGLDGLDLDRIYYWENGKINTLNRAEFRTRLLDDQILPDSVVINTALTTVGQLRSGYFEQPLAESWAGRLFSKTA